MTRGLRLGIGRRGPRAASITAALLAMLAAAGVWYFREELVAESTRRAAEGQVLRVVDGDTFKVMYKGDPDTVRVVDIAAPEMSEPGGPASKAALGRLIEGKVVRLEMDSRRLRDRYGRLLAKVYLGEADVGRKMIEDGYAEQYEWKR